MSSRFPYTLIDLTHHLDEQMAAWDDSDGFTQEITLDYAECPSNAPFRVQRLCMAAGIGTHIDSPAHCIEGGATIDQLPLANLVAPCVVIAPVNSCHERYRLLPETVERFEAEQGIIEAGSWVMIHTGWDTYWDTPAKYRNNYLFPSISVEAAKLLIERGILGLGIDTLSPDRPEDGFQVHQLVLGAGRYIIENAANLEQLPARGSFVVALPLKIRGGTEAPVRLIGLM